jgi:hypothetical protein
MATYMSREDALKHLGISRRTFYRAVNKGLLRPMRQGRALGVAEEDVVQYRRVRQASEEQLPLNRTTFSMMVSDIRMLESKVASLMRVMGLPHGPLNLTKAELAALHEMVEHYAKAGWPPHVERQLSDTFMRLRYEDLVTIAEARGVRHPAAALYRLCETMRLSAGGDDCLREELEHGRDNLHALAVLWGQLGGGGFRAVELALKKDGRPRKVVVRRIERDRRRGEGALPPEIRMPGGNE